MTVPVLINAAPKQYLIDAGVVKIGASLVLVGNSVGGIKWNPDNQSKQPDFDGKRADIQNQDRNIGGNAELSGKFLIGSMASILRATPGAESDGSDGVNTMTPIDNDLFWPEEAYGVDGVYLARKQGNKIFGILMPRFKMTTSGFQSADKGETGWDVSIKPVIPDTEEGGEINVSEQPWRYLEIDELSDLVTYLTALEA